MNRALAIIQRKLGRLGREGAVGLALLAICLGFYLIALRPSQLRLEQLRSQQSSQYAQRANATRQAAREPQTPTEQLESYYRAFPPRASTPVWLGKIYQAALHQHIQLTKGDYRAKPETSGKLVHYQIILPVKATYLQLRHFLAAVLAEVPAASLDRISLERPAIGKTVIDAKVTLTLYLGPQP